MDKRRLMGELETTLQTVGWNKVIKPTLRAEMMETYDALGNVVAKVPEGMSRSDYHYFLSGRADAFKYALTVFEKQLAEYKLTIEQEQKLATVEPGVGSPYDAAANPQ